MGMQKIKEWLVLISNFIYNWFYNKEKVKGQELEPKKVIGEINAEKMKTSEKGKNLIKHYESLHDGDLSVIGLQPKECPAGVWTVGYGHALTNEHGAWLRGKAGYVKALKLYPQYANMTEEQADILLAKDLVNFEDTVNDRLKANVAQDQFDALVSHTFNTGGSNTLFRLVNEKAEESKILKWFTEHYITSDGVFMQGLLFRRMTEALLFSTGELKYFN